jgi:hypothetical protein
MGRLSILVMTGDSAKRMLALELPVLDESQPLHARPGWRGQARRRRQSIEI